MEKMAAPHSATSDKDFLGTTISKKHFEELALPDIIVVEERRISSYWRGLFLRRDSTGFHRARTT